jgi:hypothetical protein
MRYGVLLIAALSISACATNQTWARIDGYRSDGRDLMQAKAICEPKAESAGLTSPNGLIGIAMTKSSAMKACMAERGYVLASAN